jgi:hypothetical protein
VSDEQLSALFDELREREDLRKEIAALEQANALLRNDATRALHEAALNLGRADDAEVALAQAQARIAVLERQLSRRS